MKKIMILAAGITAFAFPASAQFSIAPEVGVNLANMHWKVNNVKYDDGIKLGAKAGLNFNLPLTPDRLVLQPGLFYSTKGMKNEMTNGRKNNYTLHYVEVPLNLQYMFNDPSEGRFFIGVGPYLGIAVSGKNKSYGGTAGDSTDKLTFGSEATEDLGRFDYGAAVNVGYLLRSGLFFRGMYQHGIGNLWPSEIRQDNSVRNTNITISIGYQLGHKPKDRGPRMDGSKVISD
jgi:hypothetical protein